ncbi:hypothetical protein RAS14_11385 [Achromobacter aegrifaciens]|nr:hypothetical protein [Achromobacter aegrifaciens]MDQ1760355.1 hypothetical protein [Achromobacter aegrifaciens]
MFQDPYGSLKGIGQRDELDVFEVLHFLLSSSTACYGWPRTGSGQAPDRRQDQQQSGQPDQRQQDDARNHQGFVRIFHDSLPAALASGGQHGDGRAGLAFPVHPAHVRALAQPQGDRAQQIAQMRRALQRDDGGRQLTRFGARDPHRLHAQVQVAQFVIELLAQRVERVAQAHDGELVSGRGRLGRCRHGRGRAGPVREGQELLDTHDRLLSGEYGGRSTCMRRVADAQARATRRNASRRQAVGERAGGPASGTEEPGPGFQAGPARTISADPASSGACSRVPTTSVVVHIDLW